MDNSEIIENSTVFETIGNVEILSQQKLAVFASRSADDILSDYALKLFIKLCAQPITLAGGWQAPLEKYLFRNIPQPASANFIHYLAKDINQFKPNALQQKLIDQQKLLVLAPNLKEKRTSGSAVKKRDEMLFSQVSKVLFLYIEKDGRLERYFKQLSGLKYQIYFLEHPLNQAYIHEDVIELNQDNINKLVLT